MRGKAKGRVRPPIPEVEATIEALADDGCGVARIDGKVAFVAGGLPGERVRIAFERSRRQYDHARVVEVLSPSPDRVDPPCPHYGICGGCSLQHLDPEAQVAAKALLLREKLERFGGVEPARWLEPVSGDAWHYRRSARLGVRDVPAKGGIIVGFRERRSHFLTPLHECLVLDRRAAALLPALRELISSLSCRERLPQVEVACGDEEWALVFRHLVPLADRDVERLRAFGKDHGVRVYGQAGGPETVAPLWPADPGPLHYEMPYFGLRMAFLPTDFIQVNAVLNRTMVQRAIELLGPRDGETVLDLFCGLGNFTLPAARAAAATVIGVESDERLIAAATGNAARNGVANASFRRADLYEEAAVRELWNGLKPQRLLLDPPRSGAIEVLKLMPGKGAPERIVYVSCNPATLARDAEYLVNARGYRLEAAGVLDMFPHTSHVESIAVFEQGRKG
ncbi:MAG: 23S rRNA (uracil(1939)-C(5))-methyltransferase RlmD [Gammaproteobacteria bacterium]|jgi:23S rRNA (uracil1939-C5)-methyltransferase|nr:23S rRNA (uracil(1939)-C(5))-methyltransferase RlmD [Gammaproteobacteria bacterium]